MNNESEEINYWETEYWNIREACLWWNGFPINWTIKDLTNPKNFNAFSLSFGLLAYQD